MTDLVSSLESPHWLIVAGTVLLLLGLVGFALFSQAYDNEVTNGDERETHETDPVQTHAVNREARLAELTKNIWAKGRSTALPSKDTPVSDEEEQSGDGEQKASGRVL